MEEMERVKGGEGVGEESGETRLEEGRGVEGRWKNTNQERGREGEKVEKMSLCGKWR